MSEVKILETNEIVDLPRCGVGYNKQSTNPFEFGADFEFDGDLNYYLNAVKDFIKTTENI